MNDSGLRLEHNQVRLVHLSRSRDQSIYDPIVCRIQSFELDNAPSFVALSYTCDLPYPQHHWAGQKVILGMDESSPSPTEHAPYHILCDGVPTNVSPNLHDALLEIRQISQDSIWIWIDALSIRQNDLVERAYQVQRMDRIYATTELVMVWLGPPLPQCPYDILEFLQDFSQATEKLIDPSTGAARDNYSYGGDKVFDTSWHGILAIEAFLDKIGWCAVFWSMCRWTSRCWVLQEVALARHATLLCGHQTLDIGLLLHFISSVETLDWPAAIGKFVVQKFGLWAPTWWSNLLMIRTAIKFDKVPMILEHNSTDKDAALIRSYLLFNQLLFFARSRQCFDPRDKIYSLMGLGYRKIDSSLVSFCSVDYSKGVEDLYMDVATELLMKTRKLDLLAYTGRSLRVSNPGRPSWVPDFRLGLMNRPALAICKIARKPIWSACSGQPESGAPLAVEGNVLHCSGYQFDTVRTSYTAFPNDPASRLKLSSDVIVRILCDVGSDRIGRHSAVEALWGTLMLGPPGPLMSALPGYENMDQCFVVWTIDLLVQEGIRGGQSLNEIQVRLSALDAALRCCESGRAPGIKNVLATAQSLLDSCANSKALVEQWPHFEQAHHKQARLFQERFTQTWGTRNLVRTDRGLLASTQAPLASGDQIWFLSGTRTPFALRKEVGAADEYSPQGDCFVLDHMFGEAFEGDRYGLLATERRIKLV